MRRFALLLLAAAGWAGAEKIDFEDGKLARWILPRPSDWKIAVEGGNHFLRLLQKGEIGDPRRPLQYALLRNTCLGDFDLRVKVRRAGKSMMIAFGYQDSLHFYYAHISSDSGENPHHNGLFKVDGGERFRIGGYDSKPVLPDQKWHEIRLVRRAASGEMVLFADDDPQPRFGHLDTSFRWGRIGLGSFDETGDFDDLRIEGEPRSECR